jgi:uncharacterized protein (DUF983 family)
MSSPTPTRFQSMLRGLCPRCRTGSIFAGRFRINTQCPVCELRFGREHGYYSGAMYVSYALAAPIVIIIASILVLFHNWFMPQWSIYWFYLLTLILFVPLAPTVFRYSRIIWIHFDRFMDP